MAMYRGTRYWCTTYKHIWDTCNLLWVAGGTCPLYVVLTHVNQIYQCENHACSLQSNDSRWYTEDRMMLLSRFLQWSNEKFMPFCKQQEIAVSKMWCSIADQGTRPFNLAMDCTYHGQSEKFTPLCKRQKVVLSAVSELVLYDRMNFVR
jgi:hypothetical protein